MLGFTILIVSAVWLYMSNAVAPISVITQLKTRKSDIIAEKVVLKVILPRGQMTAIAVLKDAYFMEILERICQKRNISVQKHVLFINVIEQINEEDVDEVLEPQIESILVDLSQRLCDFEIKSIELCEDQHAEVVQPRPANLLSEQTDKVPETIPTSPTRLLQERRQSRQNAPVVKPVISVLKEDKSTFKSFFRSSSKKKKSQSAVEKKPDSTAAQSSTEENNGFKSMGRNYLSRKMTVERKRPESMINNGTGFDNLEFQANQQHSPNNDSIAPWDDPPEKREANGNNMNEIAPFSTRAHSNSDASRNELISPFSLYKTSSNSQELQADKSSLHSSSMHDRSFKSTEIEEQTSQASLPVSEETNSELNNSSKGTIRKKASSNSLTLRKQTFTKKSRSAVQHTNEVYIFEVDGVISQELQIPANIKMTKITISLPDQENVQVVLRCGQETVIDEILKFICAQKGYDYSSHSIASESNDFVLELDRPVVFYVDRHHLHDFSLIKGEKEYTIKLFMDGDKEVSLYQKNPNNENSVLMAATVERFLEILTNPELCDEDFLDTFLMCYRSFLKPLELFDTILSRFDAQLPENASPEEIEYYRVNIIQLQSQVMKIFDVWIVRYWFDFAVNTDLKNDLIDVLDSLSVDPTLGDRAIGLIEAVASENEKFENLVNISKASNNKSKSLDSMLMQYSFEDITEQLCLVNSQLYQSIHPIEFLNYIWRKKGEEEEYATPMLDRFIARFDNESYWVATEICDTKDLKKRTQILTQFIMIAKKCVDTSNFFSAFSLLGGLSMLPVERLKKTWKGLSNDAKKAYEDVVHFCDPSKNMKNYRDKLGIALPPIVPFLRSLY
eukprot:NODE_451_length_8312_cov_0.348594.p2 type:complete len:846 gc:universal NODE_451_length_8312_cov_0.348594:8085-5548(-)